MSRSILLSVSLLLMLLAIWNQPTRAGAFDWLPFGKKKADSLQCVEVRKPKKCFDDKQDFKEWQACVERGQEPVDCYVKVTRPLQANNGSDIDYPDGPHFQFDYVIRTLTDKQVRRLSREDITPFDLVDGPLCRFKDEGRIVTSSTPELDAQPSGNNKYDLKFDVAGSSSGCDDARVVHFQGEFPRVLVGGAGLPALDPSNPVEALVTNNRYTLNHPGPQYRYFSFDSFDNGTAIGSFQFLAEQQNVGQWMIIVHGHFELPDETN